MNWIITKRSKMGYHTDLNVVLTPFIKDIEKYNWILSDLEFGDTIDLPINYDYDYFILSPADFRKIVDRQYLQIIWGVIIAVPIDIKIDIKENQYPLAEGETIFKEGYIQYPGAVMEIICFDSSYTIVKFNKEELSNQFKAYFEEAIELKKFTDKYIK